MRDLRQPAYLVTAVLSISPVFVHKTPSYVKQMRSAVIWLPALLYNPMLVCLFGLCNDSCLLSR